MVGGGGGGGWKAGVGAKTRPPFRHRAERSFKPLHAPFFGAVESRRGSRVGCLRSAVGECFTPGAVCLLPAGISSCQMEISSPIGQLEATGSVPKRDQGLSSEPRLTCTARAAA